MLRVAAHMLLNRLQCDFCSHADNRSLTEIVHNVPVKLFEILLRKLTLINALHVSQKTFDRIARIISPNSGLYLPIDAYV